MSAVRERIFTLCPRPLHGMDRATCRLPPDALKSAASLQEAAEDFGVRYRAFFRSASEVTVVTLTTLPLLSSTTAGILAVTSSLSAMRELR